MTTTSQSDRELVLDRHIAAPRQAVWRCLTEPDLLVQWFTPAPWRTVKAEIDLKPGGRMLVVMADPEGKDYPNEGVYLEIIEGEKLVWTDAYRCGWLPSDSPFMTAIITLSDAQEGCGYTATARHFSAEDREKHEKMGFKEGWNQAAEQLQEIARTLAG
ncbi:SRPBCC family protein [Pseudohoeflea coraliihabitans]|uniref:SRPBCC family protein n=1 Tax=Pseudohoeflea coraliihabitans TaxID=2860393 RepID=A0ABS6WSG9_9HYPH|nr:SRPBCC family protein [Pseudohoeflea sp. DP4N28-3]MBW3098750.1 SRPBCC family protein [Pseudohoeflea sp. DP4N28-3]